MNYAPTFDKHQIKQQNAKTKIYSVGSFLPSQIVKSDDLLAEIRSDSRYEMSTDWISQKMGIIERRVAQPDASPSSLAIPACEEAIENAPDIRPDTIDMVIFTGIERDQPEPATAHVIQDRLGLNAKYTFDVANACFGFVNGIEMASQYIRSGAVRYALICTGETPTKVLYSIVDELKMGVDQKTFRKMLGGLSVGDAGGAVIVGPSDDDSGFELFNTESISHHIDKCIYHWRPDGRVGGQMQMGAIVNAIVNEHRTLIEDTLDKLRWTGFDWTLTHQMGARPFEKLGKLTGVQPKTMIKTYHLLGNITSATFPVGFKKLIQENTLSRGDKIGGCFAGSGLAIGQFGYTY